MAPTHIGFAVFQVLFGFVAFAHFQFKQFRAQHVHRFVFVAVLRAVVLTLHHDACGFVGQAHGRVGFVNVLTTGT